MENKCSRCGSVLEPGAAFCKSCGQRVYQQSPQRQAPRQPYPPRQNMNSAPAPYPPVQSPQPPKKNNTGIIITIIISATVVILVILAIIVIFILNSKPNTPENISPTSSFTLEQDTEPVKETTAPNTQKPTEKATQKPAEKPTEKAQPKETPTEAPKPKTIDYGDVGVPSADDFSSWFIRAMDGGVPGDGVVLYSGSEVSGTWKGIFYYPEVNVKEMNNIEILAGDRAASVNVIHRSISIDNGVYQPDSTPTFNLEGAIDAGSVTAYSQSGKLELYVFYQSEGKQYALGTFTNPSGETASVGLVRP